MPNLKTSWMRTTWILGAVFVIGVEIYKRHGYYGFRAAQWTPKRAICPIHYAIGVKFNIHCHAPGVTYFRFPIALCSYCNVTSGDRDRGSDLWLGTAYPCMAAIQSRCATVLSPCDTDSIPLRLLVPAWNNTKRYVIAWHWIIHIHVTVTSMR